MLAFRNGLLVPLDLETALDVPGTRHKSESVRKVMTSKLLSAGAQVAAVSDGSGTAQGLLGSARSSMTPRISASVCWADKKKRRRG